jgi:hypothetical protein
MGADGVYPHLYNGGRLGHGEVEKIILLQRNDAGWGATNIAAADWLTY